MSQPACTFKESVAMRRIVSLRLCLLAFLSLLGSLAVAQTPANFNVNSVADKVDATPGDGICSTGSLLADGHTQECTLRAAIDETNALQAANPTAHYVVTVMPGTYSLSTSETCIYTNAGSPYHFAVTSSTLCISSNLTLNGAGQGTTIVDHGLTDRDFFTSYGYNIAINNMTIQNGGQYGGSGDGGGGGINNQGNLSLSNDLLLKNHSDVGGAGVDNLGTLIVEGCTFMGNSGPAISAELATTSINTSYFTQNTAGGGAAVSIFAGSAQISNSTASGNTVESGGIIVFFSSTGTITNSTISDNTIGNSGAVTFGDTSTGTLNNVTISGNTAGNDIGGLIGGNITMSNTILAGNSGYDCAVDALTDAGHNLIQTPYPGICKITNSTLIGVDAKLGALALNGGLVPTQQPLSGSPAIGAGSSVTPGNNAAGGCTALDERGVVRGRSGNCTVGAVEPSGVFNISNINLLPAMGAQGGTALVTVYGSPFVPGSTIALRKSGQPNLPVLQSTMSPDDTSITAQLDLSKAVLGSYDLVVTTPSGTSSALAGAYTVQAASAPNLYSFVYGPPVQRAGQPAFYTLVYGNKGNADAYLVPISVEIPGGFAGLISSPVLAPPVATGQVVQDWTYVPLEVGPYSTTGFSNVPLIIPVLPAGSAGVLQFSIEAPAGTPEGTEYAIDAGLGNPYSTASNGVVDPAALAAFVAGAQSYAQNNLGVTLTSSELAQMSTYASTQLAQEVAAGGQAILQSSLGNPVLFSNSQLIIDVATYGAGLAGSSSSTTSSVRKALRALSVKPDGEAAPDDGRPACGDGSMQPGTSCDPDKKPIPTPPPPPPGPPPAPKPLTAAECRDLPNYHVSADGTECVENPRSGCAPIPVTLGPPQCNRLPIIGSVDPNEKDGPLGIGSQHFTLTDDPFHYQVEFENTPTATAPAQTVSVTDPLDTSLYDLSTFQLGPISFGPYVVSPPPGLTSYSKALDLRPSENVIVSINANLDKSTGIATWNFTSLDPATMQLVTDPTAGFLPPDINPPAGIGHVAFSVQPLASVPSGTKICNTASIVFDVNAAISTAPYCNSKDTTAPVSSVQPLPTTESSTNFTVAWTGTDSGVGVAFYTIYVSNDGGPFTAWQTQTSNTSASFSGSAGHTYGFYSIATDLLGNTEGPKTTAEATTTVAGGTPAASPSFSPGGAVYNSTQMVKISDSTPSSTIYYTTNGSLPTTQSAVYTGPVSVATTETLKAIAVALGYAQSAVATATYTITPASVAAPTFRPAPGTFTSAQMVTLSEATTGATIYYTTDGTKPTANSNEYSTPIQVSSTETINAIAIASVTSSPVASATYTITTAQCQTIDFSKGFTNSGLSLNGGATITNNLLQLTDGGLFEARSAFYTTAVPVANFTTDFTFQLLNPLADGITFTIQSNNPQIVGQSGGGLGYAGIPHSIALKMDLFDNAGEGFDSTGLYTSGAYPSVPAINLFPAGIKLHSDHVFAVHLAYVNDTGTGTITDTTTGASASLSVPGDISKLVGDTAYVGFTAGTGALTAIQNILTWTYSGGSGCSTK